jgi:hypothetical protein
VNVARRFATAIAIAALSGCDGGFIRAPETTPAWFQHPPHEEGMLYAVGAAGPGQRDTALARARQDLVSQLRLTIVADVRHNEDYASTDATGQNRAERLAQVARSDVQAKASAADLPGVTIVEQVDQREATYILLRLNRVAWADELRARIATLDAKLPTEAAAILAFPTTTPVQRLTAAGQQIRRLLPLLVERDEYLTRLRTALPGSAMPAAPIDRAALDRHLQNLLAELTVTLPDDPSIMPLQTQLIESLRQVGLRAVPANNGVNGGILQLPLVLTTRAENINGQIKLDGQLSGSLRLSADAGGTQLGGISLSERASSTREDVARERLYQKLSKRLAEDLDQRLTRMLAGN